MAQQKNKDLLTRLADRGEQVVGRITELPATKGLVDRTSALAKKIDDIQRRLRSLDPLEKRVTSIEKRLDKLEGKGSTKKKTTRRTTSAGTTTPKRAATRKRPPSSSS